MKRIRMRFQVATAASGAVALMVMGGCGGGGSSGGVNISAADRKEAHDIFQTRCATCHGQFGRGDGPGAAALNPKPQNYADAAWQQKVTDAEIEKAIVFGGASVGKSAQMVPNPDLEAKPGVVAALREKVRSFGEQ
ncbi:MAG: c-type cytochrome [bacterium]|nr:c-type cytochrome [bacterium]